MRFNLLVNYYIPRNSRRTAEYLTCLSKNLENDCIKKIVLFMSEDDSPPFDHEKIVVNKIRRKYRPTYADFFRYANENLANQDCILANSDIYFNESLSEANGFNLSGHFMCLSRWESEDKLTKHPHRSQDAWFFRSPVPYSLIKDANFTQGVSGCDELLAYRACQSGLKLLNPCKIIKGMHLHKSGFKTYNRKNRVGDDSSRVKVKGTDKLKYDESLVYREGGLPLDQELIEHRNPFKDPDAYKIISFSLYNNKIPLHVGAIANVFEAKEVYPTWKCRFYTTDDGPIVDMLKYMGAEVVNMNRWKEGEMFWRFLAADTSDVSIFRDVDSLVNFREAEAVNAWLGGEWSDKGHEPDWNEGKLKGNPLVWHRMHDNRRSHRGFTILGGMWGHRKGVKGELAEKSYLPSSIEETMVSWIKEGKGRDWQGRNQDTNFLRQAIFPTAQHSMLTHGDFGKPFPSHKPVKYGRPGKHVGAYVFKMNSKRWE